MYETQKAMKLWNAAGHNWAASDMLNTLCYYSTIRYTGDVEDLFYTVLVSMIEKNNTKD